MISHIVQFPYWYYLPVWIFSILMAIAGLAAIANNEDLSPAARFVLISFGASVFLPLAGYAIIVIGGPYIRYDKCDEHPRCDNIVIGKLYDVGGITS